MEADDCYKREDSVKDIGALLDWIAANKELDSTRVFLDGGSYGGYMVLASLVHYGSHILAAMERVGISNFVTFLESTGEVRFLSFFFLAFILMSASIAVICGGRNTAMNLTLRCALSSRRSHHSLMLTRSISRS